MSFRFDPNFVWPFPTLPVILHPREGALATAAFEGQIDTGADITIVPDYLLDEIGSVEIYPTQIRSQWGERRSTSMHLIDISIADQRFPSINVVADDEGDDILLGRNLLNRLILLLDGPGQRTDMLTRRPIRF